MERNQPSKFLYCLITDRAQYRQPLHEVAELAEEAGIDYFQLRQKDLQPAELLQLARHVRPRLTRTRLIVNGQLDVAIAADADGVHLQKANIPVSAVRERFPDLIIGYSAHSREELREAEKSGATYIFLSPVFQTRSKESFLPPLGLETFCAWIQDIRTPVFALGGIDGSNVRDLFQAGCAGAAGISFFLDNGKFSKTRMSVQ
jgi:thiamine-phosphate pyrophosphorylase